MLGAEPTSRAVAENGASDPQATWIVLKREVLNVRCRRSFRVTLDYANSAANEHEYV